MTDRSIHMIFESSGMPIPSEEEVRFEAREMVRRNGWGVPIILAVKKIADPYWREAIARCLLKKWQQLLSNKDEQVFYYDGDGNGIYCWLDAESDFRRVIRSCTAEQVEAEHLPAPVAPQPITIKRPAPQVVNNYYINQNYGPITNIEQSYVTCHQ